MRSLIIGIALFLIWSFLATWYYVSRLNKILEGPVTTEQVLPEEAADETGTTLKADSSAAEAVLSIPEKAVVQFAFNSAQFITNESLEKFISECKIYLEKKPETLVNVTGHACWIGPADYNMDLGRRRAESVAGYLKDSGLPGDRIRTHSKGETEPVADNTTAEGRSRNRRTEVIINN
ncbi:MAG: OmpA family protein [Bacteroidales bacterium]|nr:OmpA family protein [Bacteroidales bacterium]